MSLDVSVGGPFAVVQETHIGVVFLIGELAYKLKKPVRTAFLDFSTRQRRLATLLGTGAPLTDLVRQPARIVAAFHAGARRGPEITAEGGRDALRTRWADNFEELARFRGIVLDDGLVAELERRALGFVDGREPHRDAAAELACGAHAELIALQCTAPPQVIAQRLRERTGRSPTPTRRSAVLSRPTPTRGRRRHPSPPADP